MQINLLLPFEHSPLLESCAGLEPLISLFLSLGVSISSQIPRGAGSAAAAPAGINGPRTAVCWWHGSRDRLTLFCRISAATAAGGWLRAPSSPGGDSLKVGTWLRELQTPTVRQKSFNVSAKPSLFSFSTLFSLHLSQDCLFHREMHFLCPDCDACDIFSEINVSPAAFSGFWEPRGDNEWGFQPTAPGSLTREFREHLQKCTSVS